MNYRIREVFYEHLDCQDGKSRDFNIMVLEIQKKFFFFFKIWTKVAKSGHFCYNSSPVEKQIYIDYLLSIFKEKFRPKTPVVHVSGKLSPAERGMLSLIDKKSGH
jgi:hypothetical protein